MRFTFHVFMDLNETPRRNQACPICRNRDMTELPFQPLELSDNDDMTPYWSSVDNWNGPTRTFAFDATMNAILELQYQKYLTEGENAAFEIPGSEYTYRWRDDVGFAGFSVRECHGQEKKLRMLHRQVRQRPVQKWTVFNPLSRPIIEEDLSREICEALEEALQQDQHILSINDKVYDLRAWREDDRYGQTPWRTISRKVGEYV